MDNCNNELTCKLTSPELQQRKVTIIDELKKQVIERQEKENGFRYSFPGTDTMITQLTAFIKTERQCCAFFVFNLTITNEESSLWLEISGPAGAKDFIINELNL